MGGGGGGGERAGRGRGGKEHASCSDHVDILFKSYPFLEKGNVQYMASNFHS